MYDLCLESGRLELLRSTDVPGSPRFDGREYRWFVGKSAPHDDGYIYHLWYFPIVSDGRLIVYLFGILGVMRISIVRIFSGITFFCFLLLLIRGVTSLTC